MSRLLATGLALALSVCLVRGEPLPGRGGGGATPARSHPRITVRIYDGTRVDHHTRNEAVNRARKLLNAAGLSSRFHDCTPGAATFAKVCETSPAPGDLIVRMLRAPDGSIPTTRHVLGFALIDATTRRGTMATVFTDKVAALSTLARVPIETVLGRTIAHEIGHLLLGSNEHGTMGLMREAWTLDELASGKKENWAFTSAELARLRGPA
jgi:hypothetical protein